MRVDIFNLGKRDLEEILRVGEPISFLIDAKLESDHIKAMKDKSSIYINTNRVYRECIAINGNVYCNVCCSGSLINYKMKDRKSIHLDFDDLTIADKKHWFHIEHLDDTKRPSMGVITNKKVPEKMSARYISTLKESEFPEAKLGNLSVSFRGAVILKERAPKKDGNLYTYMKIRDGEGVVEFPIWTNHFRVATANCSLQYVDYDYEDINVGDMVTVSGDLDFYEGKPQIKNPVFGFIDIGDSRVDFIEKYEIDLEEIEGFLEIIDELPEYCSKFAKRALGLDGDFEKWTEFMMAPAALKHHHSKVGGLFLHTLGVVTNIINMRDSYDDKFHYARAVFEGHTASDKVKYDRLILTAILHDLMKIKDYKGSSDFVVAMNYIKEKEPYMINSLYEESDYFSKCDHIPKGVAYIHEINKELDYILKEDEVDDICYSILSHHGQWSPYPPKSIEDLLLHLGDMIDSKIFKFNETGGI